MRGADGVARIGGGCCSGVTDTSPFDGSKTGKESAPGRSSPPISNGVVMMLVANAEPPSRWTRQGRARIYRDVTGRSTPTDRRYLRCPDMLHLSLARPTADEEAGVLRRSVDDSSGADRRGIAWVELNRPEKRNAMSPTLNAEMVEVLARARRGRRLRRPRADRRGRGMVGRDGPEGVLSRGRRRARARAAARPA